jgi:hypothetical protein
LKDTDSNRLQNDVLSLDGALIGEPISSRQSENVFPWIHVNGGSRLVRRRAIKLRITGELNQQSLWGQVFQATKAPKSQFCGRNIIHWRLNLKL